MYDTEKQITETFAANLRKQRTQHGWTQLELSIKSGVSQGIIVNIESGRHATRLKNAVLLTRALNTTIEEMISETQ